MSHFISSGRLGGSPSLSGAPPSTPASSSDGVRVLKGERDQARTLAQHTRRGLMERSSSSLLAMQDALAMASMPGLDVQNILQLQA